MQIFKDNPIYIYIAIVALVAVIGFVVTIILSAKNNNKNKNFLKEHPEAVEIKFGSMGTRVVTMNGEEPFIKSMAVYALPGENVIEVKHQYDSMTITGRRKVTTVGPVKIKAVIEKNKKYKITYDKKANEFNIEEI